MYALIARRRYKSLYYPVLDREAFARAPHGGGGVRKGCGIWKGMRAHFTVNS